MSSTVIFIVGVVVFAITVYGSVMAAGIAMTRVEIEQDPKLQDKVDKDELNTRFPDVKY